MQTRALVVAIFAIVVAGIGLALMTAQASPDMVFALSPSQLRLGQILRVLISDPGWTLNETMQSGVGWGLSRIGIGATSGVPSRALADLAILSVAWGLRKNKTCLAGMLLAIFGFEIIFRLVYPGVLRHEGILVFLLISLSWLACSRPSATEADRRAVSLGLLPLLIAQTLALPVVAGQDFTRPESSSKAFGALIRNNPAYRNSILMGEPDYMMESLLYYVPNPVYMPRQGEFQHRVYFDRGTRRRQRLQLGTLVGLADPAIPQIVRVVAVGAGRGTVGALPVPSAVVCHDGVLVGDQLRDEVPVSMVEPRCVDQHDGRARPGRLHEEVDAIEADHRHRMPPFVSSYINVVRFIRPGWVGCQRIAQQP